MSSGSSDFTGESLARAVQALQRGAVDEARRLLGAVVARDPDNADALNLIGVVHAQRRELAAAEEALRRAIASAPAHAGAHLNYGGVLRLLGRLQEAGAHFERAVELRPDAPIPALRQLGSVMLDLYRNEEAAAAFTRILALAPQDAVALNDRGLAYLGLGRLEDALAAFETALKINPRFASAISNKGLALMRFGRNSELETALTCFESAISFGAPTAAVWALKGEALQRLGRLADAAASFERALAQDARNWEALMGLGRMHLDAQRFGDAVDAFNRAANARPDAAPAYLARARAARGLANLQAALYDVDRALTLAPDDVDALSMRMGVRRELGQREEALADCMRAIELNPTDANLHNSRGVLLDELSRTDEALRCFERVLELDPRNPAALQNLGVALVALKRGDEALATCNEQLAHTPRDAELWTMKGAVLVALRRFDEALAAYDRAIAEQPDHATAQFHRSFVLLVQGKYREGFAAYEWRRRGSPPFVTLPRFDVPELASAFDAQGKRLMLYCEQGLGDIIQYARFARSFADRGAKVSVFAYPALARLLASLGADIEIVQPETPMPALDVVYPLMSATHILGTTLETIPARVPYLAAPTELVETWRVRLQGVRAGLRVGLAWSGSQTHVTDSARSIPFEKLRALLGVAGVTYFSVQKDVRASDEIALADSGVIDQRDLLTDFAETAALVQQLDLVVTVDTSVAHLAGALGKPVWVMLPTRVDWRWGAQGSTSPWYPTARLFRQTSAGDWAPVLADVRAALEALASAQ